MATYTVEQQVQQIYIGLLGRAADKPGLDYWVNEIDTGVLSIEELRANIVNEQPEYAAGLGSLSRAQVVAELYQNLFERAPEPAGLEYWVNGGGATVNIDQLVLAMVDGAGAGDRLVMENKTEAATYYTVQAGEDFTRDAANAAVENVDSTRASVEDSKAATDAGTQASGETFTLTTGVDDLNGTADNDKFVGLIDGNNTTLTALDAIDGGAGVDSLTVNSVTGAPATFPTISLTSVETVNLRAAVNSEADLSSYSDVTKINSTQSAGTLDLTASATADVNVSGGAGEITVDGGKNVSVTDATANQNITVGDTTESAGTVSVTDSKQGTGVITVEGGTDATVNATVTASTADVAGGNINVGNNTDQPTGAISVTQNNVNPGAQISAGTPAVLAFDLAGLVLDTNDTLQFANAGTVFTATADNTTASAVASAIAGTTETVNGVTYDATANGTIITYTAQTNTGNNVSTDFGALSSTDNAPGGAANYSAPTSVAATTDTDGTAQSVVDLTAGAINVQGGTSIDIDVNSTSTAAASTSNGDITNGTVTATAGDNTTSINVAQDLAATTNTKAATDLVGGTATVTFKALASGETVTVGGLTFEAAKNLTAAEVAGAFAGLTAEDAQGNGSTAQGFYTNDLNANITSGAVSGNTVVFTNTAAAAAPTLGLASSAGATSLPTATTTTGTAAVGAVTSTNTVTAGAVTANDNATASVTDITLSSFGTANLGLTNGFDALVNLSLTDSNGDVTLDTAATSLTMNVNDVTNAVDIDSGAATVTNLTINASGDSSSTNLTAAVVTDLTVAAAADLTLTGASTLSALKNATVTGSGDVSLGDISATAESLSASAATGDISATVDGTKAVVTTGTGDDSITVDTAGISKAINLGEGDDTLTLGNPGTATVPTAAVAGGAGVDTIAMNTASAASLDDNTNFATAISGFERLAVTNQLATSADVDLEALGFDYVTLNQGSAGAAALSNLASNGTVALEAALGGALTVNVKDAATGTADVLNLSVTGDSTIAAGTVIADDVETFNIAANDVFVDSSSPKDGKDNNDAVHTLTANGDSVTSVVVTGDDLVLDTNSTVLTSVDASALAGGLEYTADGAAAGTTVTGGQGSDSLTASGSNDVLNGGAGDDTLTGANLTQLTGGAGSDTFALNATAPTNVNSYSTITDLEAGDVIDLSAATATGQSFVASAVTLASTAVFQDFANAAVNQLAADDEDFAWFQFNGNTYIVGNDDQGDATNANFENGVDSIIQIAGLVDLSTASYNQTDGTLEIA